MATHKYLALKPNYHVYHKLVREIRGSATKQTCVDCGEKAREWSLDPETEDHLEQQETGQAAGRWFSLNLEDYRPRCTGCHRRFDAQKLLRPL